MIKNAQMPPNIGRCPGREPPHPLYTKECCSCMRLLSPPHAQQQAYIKPWDYAHGDCPDRIPLE